MHWVAGRWRGWLSACVVAEASKLVFQDTTDGRVRAFGRCRAEWRIGASPVSPKSSKKSSEMASSEEEAAFPFNASSSNLGSLLSPCAGEYDNLTSFAAAPQDGGCWTHNVTFEFVVHGVLMGIVGLFGLIGNIISIVVLSRPQVAIQSASWVPKH